MKIADLTAIIPFRNETKQVYWTVKSLRTVFNGQIILVDDCSDEYPYQRIAKEFGCLYVRNEENLGVAGSRMVGAELCKTKWLWFLDAHMRFIGDYTIPTGLDERNLYYSQSGVMKELEDGKIHYQDNFLLLPKGCAIDFERKSPKFLSAQWKIGNMKDYRDRIETPCCMGASYFIAKKTFDSFHGLNLLSGWGMDEEMLSTKVWLSGGEVILLADNIVHHLYKPEQKITQTFPFQLLNKLVYAQLFLEQEDVDEFMKHIVDEWKDMMAESLAMHGDAIKVEREFLKPLFKRKIEDYILYSKSYE